MELSYAPLREAGVTVLAPDIVWDGAVGDFQVAISPEEGGAGDLVSIDPLSSAVLVLLFTDARPIGLTVNAGDLRGWPGDGFDLRSGESPIGSTLWRYRRAALNENTLREVGLAAEIALKPLARQGLVDRITATARADGELERLTLSVGLYLRGEELFGRTFGMIWNRDDL